MPPARRSLEGPAPGGGHRRGLDAERSKLGAEPGRSGPGGGQGAWGEGGAGARLTVIRGMFFLPWKDILLLPPARPPRPAGAA